MYNLTGEWSIARAQKECPDVRIKFGGTVYTAQLSGTHKWAKVWFRINGSLVNVEFCWQAIVHNLNTGGILQG